MILYIGSIILSYYNFKHIFWFIYCNELLLFLITLFVLKRIRKIFKEQKQNKAGSKLHIQIVTILSLFVIIPVLLITFCFVVFVHLGMNAWFNDVVKTAIHGSQYVGEAYFSEHYKRLEQNLKILSTKITAKIAAYPYHNLNYYLSQKSQSYGFDEILITNHKRKIIAHSLAPCFLESEINSLNFTSLNQLKIYINWNKGKLIGLYPFLSYGRGFYLITSQIIPPSILNRISLTHEAVEAYQYLLEERTSVSSQFAFLSFLLTLLLLLLAIWLGLNIADAFINPIGQLIEAAIMVQKGNLSIRVSITERFSELALLGKEFNQMAIELESQRLSLTLINQEIEMRQKFTENILKGVSSGVLGLDRFGYIHLKNRAAIMLLKLPEYDGPLPKRLEDCIPEFSKIFKSALKHKRGVRGEQVTIIFRGTPRVFRVYLDENWSEISSDKNFIMTFDDITDLLIAQQQAAWAEVARRVAHEIKNPLTPIQLSAERLRRKYTPHIHKNSEIFHGCIDTILRQVESIDRIVAEFSSFARLPQLKSELKDLIPFLKKILEMHKQMYPQILFKKSFPSKPLYLHYDEHQITQALTNIFKNSIESIEEKRKKNPDQTQGEIHLNIIPHPALEKFLIEITDNGLGFPKSIFENLLKPYISTKPQGRGLGLSIVKKIIEDHNGELILENRTTRFGAKVMIYLPKLFHLPKPHILHGK